jgi:murein DD-endopeptidase MepM/ murein hydrolase activator NlpD
LTDQSLAISSRPLRWFDQAFLWAATSLTVMAIAATLTNAARWPAGADAGVRMPPAPTAHRPVPAAAPPQAPLIAFSEPEPGYPVISPFGIRQLPWEEAGRLHKGVDIAAPQGEPVLAAAAGVVLKAGVDAGYGRFVEIAHAAGMSTLYGHLSAFAIRPGMAVRQGQAIGRIGSTGSSTGSHLHFEVHDARGRALNPELFLDRSFMTQNDLPVQAALRMPRRVRIAYVSSIPPDKQTRFLARQDAQAEAAETRTRAASPAPVQLTPQKRIVLAAASGIRILGSGPDGRIHAVIQPGG